MSSKITLVLGGARSGKSRFAVEKIKVLGQKRAFIATAEPIAEEMQERIFMPLIFFYAVVNIFDLPINYLWVSMFIIITSAAIYMKIYTKKQLEFARAKI